MVGKQESTDKSQRRTKHDILSSPKRPTPVPVKPEGISAELTEEKRWVCWRFVWKQEKKRWDKVPIDPKTGKLASSTDPETWGPFSATLERYTRYSKSPIANHKLDGIGFVLGDGWAGVDLDDCRDPATRELEAWAKEMLTDLHSYSEVSPTRTGVKVFLRGRVPPGGNRKGNVEMYDSGRYFTVTGHKVANAPQTVNKNQKALARLHAKLFPPSTDIPRPAPDSICSSEATINGNAANLSDEEIIRRAGKARGGDRFKKLWAGDTTDYASHSEADLALCCMLTDLTGPVPDRIDQLFRQSGLMRDKWDERRGGQTYGQLTIMKALESRSGLLLEHEPGGGKKQKITARMQGTTVHIDTIDPANANHRRRFAEAVVEKMPGADRAAIDAELLAIGDATGRSGTQPGGEGEEVDTSRIVRPEQFYTPEVSGLAVPIVRRMDGEPSARWMQYLQWEDGQRERRELGICIDLPSGEQLCVNPVPGVPSVTSPQPLVTILAASVA